MKTVETSKGTFVFEMVVVSESFQVVKNKLSSELFFRFPNLYITDAYRFLCTTDTITEDIAKMIFNHRTHPLFKGRIVFERIKTENLTHWSFSIKECIDTLLEVDDLDPLKNYAILKKND